MSFNPHYSQSQTGQYFYFKSELRWKNLFLKNVKLVEPLGSNNKQHTQIHKTSYLLKLGFGGHLEFFDLLLTIYLFDS